MHRIYLLPLILLLSLTVVIVAAQEDTQPGNPTPIPLVLPDEFEVSSENGPAGSSYFMGLNGSPFLVSAGPGSDLCSTATTLTTADSGSQMNVAAMTQSVNDPDLACMWGSPTSAKGYRTVWYKFTPLYNGILTVSTLPASTSATNSYDTVLAVHEVIPHSINENDCDNLIPVIACNDDLIGFSSTVTLNVRRNTTYYIEVADWQAGGNAIKTLDLSIQINPFTSFWQNAGTQPPTLTARQASVVVGSDIYLIGGRGDSGSLVSSFQKYNTATGTWQNPALPSIPGGGFLNTTAVYLPAKNGLNPRIYLPGGSIQSSDQAYSRQHQYFDFTTGTWNTAAKEVGDINVAAPFAYAAAARNNANDGYFLTGGIVGQGYPPITSTTTTLDQVLFYQPTTDDWFPRASMTSPRYGHVAANVGGRLCVAGGLNTNGLDPALLTNGECANGTSPTGWTPTGVMQVPRYFAHGSVGPDGKWYVYGGIDGKGFNVPEIEVYDPATNAWSILGLLYDLGGQSGKPAVVRPGGGFVGNYLWAAGGSYDATGNSLNPLVGKVQILGNNTYLPVIFSPQSGNNHSFEDAWPISLNNTISQHFSNTRTLVNVYSFTVTQLGLKQVALTGVASTANLNLYLYGENKDIVGSDESPFPGVTKTITMPLNPGRYYVVVRYNSSSNFPNDLSDDYQIRVNG